VGQVLAAQPAGQGCLFTAEVRLVMIPAALRET